MYIYIYIYIYICIYIYLYLLPFIIIFISYTILHYRYPLYRVTPVLHVTHTCRKIPLITAKIVKSAIERLETPDTTSPSRKCQPVTRITRLADILYGHYTTYIVYVSHE